MLPLGIGDKPTKRPAKELNNLAERTGFQYVTPEGIQQGTKDILKAGWKTINRLFLSLVPGRHIKINWVFVLEAENHGYKNVKC